jgi:uncharacterized protein (TIGR03067 family)
VKAKNDTAHSSAVAEELKKLQGTWVQVECEADGVKNPHEDYGEQNITAITGNTFTVTHADGTVVIKGTFTLNLDPDPKYVDWSDTFGVDAGKTFPAIYILDDDTFTFCAGDKGARPTTFHTKKNQVRRILKRIKP